MNNEENNGDAVADNSVEIKTESQLANFFDSRTEQDVTEEAQAEEQAVETEAQEEESKEEVSEVSEESEVEDESQEEDEADEADEEIEAEEDEDESVLSQSKEGKGIDKLTKRVDKLTFEKKTLEEEIESLRQELESKPKESASAPKKSTAADIDNLADLDKFRESAEETIDWAEDILEGDHFEEHDTIKFGENEYTKKDIQAIKSRARSATRDVRAQEKLLNQQAQFDAQAEQLFPDFADPKSELSKFYEAEMKMPNANIPFSKMPNRKQIMGYIALGIAAAEKNQEETKKKPVKAKKKAVEKAPRVSGVEDTQVPIKRTSDEDKKADKLKKFTSAKRSEAELAQFFAD